MHAPPRPDPRDLRLVVDDARSSMAGCRAASLAVVRGEEAVMVVGTSALGRRLEEAQWAAGHGPGIDALRQLQVFNVASLASAPAWPEFTELALAQGVRSTLAVPVTAGGRALGVLNLYSADVDAFSGREPIALRYASDAASMLAGSEWTAVVRRPGPVGTTEGPAVVPAAT